MLNVHPSHKVKTIHRQPSGKVSLQITYDCITSYLNVFLVSSYKKDLYIFVFVYTILTFKEDTSELNHNFSSFYRYRYVSDACKTSSNKYTFSPPNDN